MCKGHPGKEVTPVKSDIPPCQQPTAGAQALSSICFSHLVQAHLTCRIEISTRSVAARESGECSFQPPSLCGTEQPSKKECGMDAECLSTTSCLHGLWGRDYPPSWATESLSLQEGSKKPCKGKWRQACLSPVVPSEPGACISSPKSSPFFPPVRACNFPLGL